MSRDAGAAEIYRFGDCELRVRTRELLRRNEGVTLEPRAFDLLAFLLANRERVVSKDELHDAIWPGRYVSEASLARGIMKSRRAVGDDADRQHTIKTVHGRGYRFVAELIEADPPSSRVPDRRSVNPWVLGGSVTAMLALIVAAFFLRDNGDPATGSTDNLRIAVLPVANNTGSAELEWIEFGLMDVLASQLLRQSGLPVTAPSEIVTFASRNNAALAAGAGLSDEMSSQLLERFSATHLVSSNLERPGQLYRLTAQISSRSQPVVSLEVMGSDPLDLVTEFRRQLEQKIAGSRPAVIAARTVSDDTFVNEAYVRGRDLLLRGDLEQARTLLQAAADQEPENFWARHALATVVLNLGDADAAASILRELLDQAQREGSALKEASALFLLGNTRLRKNDYDSAEKLYGDALAIFVSLDMPFEQGKVLTNQAIIAGERHDLMVERSLLERAAAAFSNAGLELTPAPVLGGLANNALDRGELEDAQRYFELALSAFRERGQRDQEAVSLYSLSRVAEYRGDFALAYDYAEQSLSIARDVGHRWGEAASLRRLGAIAMAAGNLDRASTVYLEALEIGRTLGASTNVASVTTALAELDRLEGRFDDAAERLAEAAAIVQNTGDEIGAAWIEVRRGRLALDLGDIEQAMASADRSLSNNPTRMPALDADAHDLMGRALTKAGQPERALVAFGEALAASERGSNRHRRAQLAAELGLLSLDLDLEDQAIGYLGVARDASPEAFEVLLLSAAVSARDGRWTEAAGQFDAASQRAIGLWSARHEQRRTRALADAPENL